MRPHSQGETQRDLPCSNILSLSTQIRESASRFQRGQQIRYKRVDVFLPRLVPAVTKPRRTTVIRYDLGPESLRARVIVHLGRQSSPQDRPRVFRQGGHVLVLRDEERTRTVPVPAGAGAVGLPPVVVDESKGQQFGHQAGGGQIQRFERFGFRSVGSSVAR